MAVNVTRLYWSSFLAFTALIHLITALIHVVCHEVDWILVCLVHYGLVVHRMAHVFG